MWFPIHELGDGAHVWLSSIVAVHGLTGHAWKTFTTIEDGGPSYSAKRENNWLQENLPRLLKQHREQNIYARVMSYGYNADVWMTDSAAELDVPVDTLLWALQNERQEVRKLYISLMKPRRAAKINLQDPDRPLFLIGHSLGGIVIKEVLLHYYPQFRIGYTKYLTGSQKDR